MPSRIMSKEGFTLVELMITLLISSVVMVVIYTAYSSQRKIHKRQEAVVDMQQNARAGLYLMRQEMRMAGYDPFRSAGAGIQNTNNGPTSIRFSQDLNEDGDASDANEDITLAYNPPAIPGDPGTITRADNNGGGAQPFINNVDFFELIYTLEDGTVTDAPPPSNLDQIETVQANILVRSSVQEPELVNTLDYDIPPPEMFYGDLNTNPPAIVGTNIAPVNDSFRRRLVSTTIQCRNASL